MNETHDSIKFHFRCNSVSRLGISVCVCVQDLILCARDWQVFFSIFICLGRLARASSSSRPLWTKWKCFISVLVSYRTRQLCERRRTFDVRVCVFCLVFRRSRSGRDCRRHRLRRQSVHPLRSQLSTDYELNCCSYDWVQALVAQNPSKQYIYCSFESDPRLILASIGAVEKTRKDRSSIEQPPRAKTHRV